jgi:hypothetical protein
MRLIAVFLVVLISSLIDASAATLIVPSGPYPTIQSAITAATTGDTVLVSPGTFTGSGNKNLDYAGKSIVVRSSGGSSVTTIDCQNSGCGVNFDAGETSSAVFDGFTITNGEDVSTGAAINISASSPTISNCRITGNTTTFVVYGGAVAINGSPSFVNCTIDANSHTTGGIVFVESGAPSFTGCDVTNNDGVGVLEMSGASGNYTNCNFDLNSGDGVWPADGAFDNCTFNENSGLGAVVAGDASFTFCDFSMNMDTGVKINSGNPTFDDCDIAYNYSPSGAGGVFIQNDPSPVFTACDISANQGTTTGGVYIDPAATVPQPILFTDCTITGNSGTQSGGVMCYGAIFYPLSITFTGCTIAGNKSNQSGGALLTSFVFMFEDVNIDLTGCTIADNEAVTDGGGIALSGAADSLEVTLTETILWGNCASGTGDEASVAAGTLLFECSIVDSTEVTGAGTITYDGLSSYLDPFYCGASGCTNAPSMTGDYTVTDDSPALAANNPCGLDIGAHPPGCIAPFTDVTSGPLGDSGNGFTAAWGDYDNDSDPDLYVGNGFAPADNKLLRNDGSTLFTDVTTPPLDSLVTGAVAWGDYDDDGDLDLYAIGGSANRLYRNDGAGVFTDVTTGPLGDTGSGKHTAWLDYDSDGDLDIYLVNNGGNKLFRNDGGGTFTDQTNPPLDDSSSGFGLAVADYDNDGDPDIYVGNHGASSRLFRNDGGGIFTDVTVSPLDQSTTIGASWGDYNNDGYLDLYLACDGANYLLQNNSGVSFTDVTGGTLGDTEFCPRAAWMDYDNDGDLDLHLVNLAAGNKLLRNDGGGTFSDVTFGWIGDATNSTNSSWGDYDGDGDVDVYVTSQMKPNKLLRNNLSNGNHWLQIDLHGTTTNRFGIGTRIRIVAGGLSQIMEVQGIDQHSSTVEFGLGSSTIVDSIQVSWLSQTITTLNIPADQRITLKEGFVIDEIADIPNDQGRQVRIEWERCQFDVAGSPTPITQYAVYRKIDTNLTASLFGGFGLDKKQSAEIPDAASLALGWDFLLTIPASAEEGYAVVVPTLKDSTVAEGVYYSVFFVRALTATPSIYFDTPPDSGYSVDNLAPFVPAGFTVAYNTGSGNSLSWDMSQEEDLQYYRIYRSTDPEFSPSPSTLVDGTKTNSWTDPSFGDPSVYYKITAVDYSGNESDSAPPDRVTAAGNDATPSKFAVHQNAPNPFNPFTTIRFDVPRSGGHVSIRIYDVSGRLIRTLTDRNHSPGVHEIRWDGTNERGQSVATGVYYCRMKTTGFSETRKMVLLK